MRELDCTWVPCLLSLDEDGSALNRLRGDRYGIKEACPVPTNNGRGLVASGSQEDAIRSQLRGLHLQLCYCIVD